MLRACRQLPAFGRKVAEKKPQKPAQKAAVDASAKKKGPGTPMDKLNELYMNCMEPKPVPVVPLTPEESERGTRLAKQYQRMMWKRHKMQMMDTQEKIRLKWRAIYALPTLELRKEALFIDDSDAPLDLPYPTWTPPLRGFHWRDAELDDEFPEK